MRNSAPIFWPNTEYSQSLIQTKEKNYSDCINILQTQWYQADLDERFVMGDQDLWGLIFPGVATYRRKIFNFNIINSIIQLTSGYQRRNRKSSICVPLTEKSQRTADQFTKILFHVHKNGGYNVYSDCFEQGALTSGLGFCGIYLDYTQDPVSPDIKLRYINMKNCLFDPWFRKTDGSDMRFFWTRQFFDKHEAAILYPQFKDEIMALPAGTYRDDKFYYMPEVYQIQFPNLIAFDEYWYLSQRTATYLVDKKTGEAQEYTGREEDLDRIMRTFKKLLTVVKQPKPTYRRTIILNDRVMIDEERPYGTDRLPYVPFLAYFNPDTPYYAYKFRGQTRDLRDSQYLFNRLKVSDLDTIEAQQQGLKVKKGALVTPDDSLNQGNGRVLTIDPAFSMDDVQQMDIHPPAPARLQMEDMLKQIMNQISGVNETLLGTDISDKAGIISAMRQAAGVTTLTRLFDQCDEAQRLCGEIIIELAQHNWTYGKVKQIIGEEPVAEFDNKLFLKYGCKVIQGSLTETQQQMELGQILHLHEVMQTNPAPPIMERIIDTMFIQNKDKLKEGMAKFQQAQQEQQTKMAELQMQQMQVDTETKLSYAESQKGLAAERVAKIQTDKAVAIDKLRKSHQEDTTALANLVRALKDIQGVDLDNLSKNLGILQQIETLQNPEAGQREMQEASA